MAYRKARKRKTLRKDVLNFSQRLEENLLQLKHELETFTYEPRPLRNFVIRDPKTRNISASDFRDRVIHHALCNVIEPVFDKTFIDDSYANRTGKGTLAALQRFDEFKRKISKGGVLLCNSFDNNTVLGFALKCDIKHYFESVNHEILLEIIERKIKDENIIWLIEKILANHSPKKEMRQSSGMPLGNLTSQFFANVYLNELDYFVKHELPVKFYIRYVDDFVILHESRHVLGEYEEKTSKFLFARLDIQLHPEKSKIVPLHKGVRLLGFRCFYHFMIPKKSNIRFMEKRIEKFEDKLRQKQTTPQEIDESTYGWCAYAMLGNTYRLRKRIMKNSRAILKNKL